MGQFPVHSWRCIVAQMFAIEEMRLKAVQDNNLNEEEIELFNEIVEVVIIDFPKFRAKKTNEAPVSVKVAVEQFGRAFRQWRLKLHAKVMAKPQ